MSIDMFDQGIILVAHSQALPFPHFSLFPPSYTWHFPTEHSKFMVFVPRNEVLKDNGTALLAQLWAYTNEEIAAMKANVVNLIPHIVYAAPGHNLTKHRDAFEVAVDRILQRVHTRVEQ